MVTLGEFLKFHTFVIRLKLSWVVQVFLDSLQLCCNSAFGKVHFDLVLLYPLTSTTWWLIHSLWWQHVRIALIGKNSLQKWLGNNLEREMTVWATSFTFTHPGQKQVEKLIVNLPYSGECGTFSMRFDPCSVCELENFLTTCYMKMEPITVVFIPTAGTS